MNLTFLKNPIILGIIAGALTYLYLWWDADKKHKKNPTSKKQQASIITPAIIAVVVWFLASSYFDSGEETSDIGVELPKNEMSEPVKSENRFNLADTSISSGSRTYHMIGKNKVRLPETDVFIDLAKF